jgi:lysophospholipase L1-like esterase
MLFDANQLIPASSKRNCFVMVSTPMPRYLSMISKLERSRELRASMESQNAWTKAGYHSGDFQNQLLDEDFSDGVHLSPSGGRKIAAIVAEKVRAIKSELGHAG